MLEIFDVGLAVYFIGCLGLFFFRSNLISVLIAIELVLLSINYLFVLLSVYHQDIQGQFYAMSILSVAAAESALGLSIVLIFYRVKGSVFVEDTNLLKA